MYNRGELVMIPVPYTDLSATKKRPVLVISNNKYNAKSQDMIVAAVTSNVFQQGIAITNAAMEQGQLPKPSIIRSDKIYTLNQGIVAKRIGCVKAEIMDAVQASVIRHISD